MIAITQKAHNISAHHTQSQHTAQHTSDQPFCIVIIQLLAPMLLCAARAACPNLYYSNTLSLLKCSHGCLLPAVTVVHAVSAHLHR
jgi:hypothetical protein